MTRRLAAAPLIDFARRRAEDRPRYGLRFRCRTGVTVSDVADVLGVHHSQVSRWSKPDATVGVFTADVYANRLRAHPAELWGDDWWAIPERASA